LVQITITVGGRAGPGEALELRSRLIDEDALRGQVTPAGHAPQGGELGSQGQALLIMLGSGAGPALVHAWVAWLRYGRKGVTATLTRPDGGAVELSVERVRDLAPDELSRLLSELCEFVDGGASGGGGEQGAGEQGIGEQGAGGDGAGQPGG
jgi:hypothetical protein